MPFFWVLLAMRLIVCITVLHPIHKGHSSKLILIYTHHGQNAGYGWNSYELQLIFLKKYQKRYLSCVYKNKIWERRLCCHYFQFTADVTPGLRLYLHDDELLWQDVGGKFLINHAHLRSIQEWNFKAIMLITSHNNISLCEIRSRMIEWLTTVM